MADGPTGVGVYYATIGNSDDGLTQAQWAVFSAEFIRLIRHYAEEVYGVWHSGPAEPWQNCCAGFRLRRENALALRGELTTLRIFYSQDSIAWAIVTRTEFI